MIKGLTISGIFALMTTWTGIVYSYATLSEREATDRASIDNLKTVEASQWEMLRTIDSRLVRLDEKLSGHIANTQR